MAHAITNTDGLVLVGEKAWHGLGTVVVEAPSPTDALKLARLDWEVLQYPLVGVCDDGSTVNVNSHVVNIRSDNGDVLGVVGCGWKPIHNIELAHFMDALAFAGDVKIETMGSVQSGRKVWGLAKGDAFEVGSKGSDAVFPYLLVAVAHDGSMSLRVVPTSVRVVCKNTWDMALGTASGGWNKAAVRVQHSGDVMSKVSAARDALKLFGVARDETARLANTLASASVSRAEIDTFWRDVYQSQYGAIPTRPADAAERRQRDKAVEAFADIARRFDREANVFGASKWTMVNAYTGWIQHESMVRGAGDDSREDNRLASRLFGTIGKRTQEAFEAVLSA